MSTASAPCAASWTPARTGRSGAHFGAYDFLASCGITAEVQHIRHPSCDFAAT